MTEQEMTTRIELALRYPWTVRVAQEDGQYVARVAEMPDALAVADTPEALERELWASIRASLRARLEFGDPIPVPSGTITRPAPTRPVVRRTAPMDSTTHVASSIADVRMVGA